MGLPKGGGILRPVAAAAALASAVAAAEPGRGEILFADVTESAGLSFRHRHGGAGDKHIFEIMGGGGGFFDYDGDGDLDIYLLNGAPQPGYAGPRPLRNALYRNDDGRFVDVTEAAGLTEPGYSMGCAAADYDNDGDLDLFISSYGPNRLYRNDGDGTFRDVTEAAGVGDDRFGTSAAFADADADGDLDLYVANYVTYRIDSPVYCGNRRLGIRTYCHPDNYDGASDLLYENLGDGSFRDVARAAGVELPSGKGLGVAFSDYDADGDPDLYVANDSVMNFLFRNEGGLRFTEMALALGAGFSESGRAEAGMGVDVADYDGDGKLDIFVTNFEFETNTLYRNVGDGSFLDATFRSGLGAPSLPWVGFGTNFFDADNDADPDVFVANGHIMDQRRLLSDSTSFEQRNQIYENDEGRFTDVSSGAGGHFALQRISRGAAFGDVDDDGAVDLLVMNNDDAPNLLRNETAAGNHWIRIRLVGVASNRDGIGVSARIEAGGVAQLDELRSGTSYLSQNDLRLHFGLGPSERVERLTLRWPSGVVDTLTSLPVDREILIREGGGALPVGISTPPERPARAPVHRVLEGSRKGSPRR